MCCAAVLTGMPGWPAAAWPMGSASCCLHAGFGLVHVKLTSTWAEHCPAYFLAISLEKKEVIISVRGTAQVEDVITDLTALPRVRTLD